jgi:hypothetical protein
VVRGGDHWATALGKRESLAKKEEKMKKKGVGTEPI